MRKLLFAFALTAILAPAVTLAQPQDEGRIQEVLTQEGSATQALQSDYHGRDSP